MTNYTAKHIKDMEAAFGGGFVKARAELGVTSFGMQVINMPPDYGDYPEHDHEKDGQEEVYVALAGGGWIDIEGDRVELVQGPAGARRGRASRARSTRARRDCACSSIGGCPGKAYEIPEMHRVERGLAAGTQRANELSRVERQRCGGDQPRAGVHVLELDELDGRVHVADRDRHEPRGDAAAAEVHGVGVGAGRPAGGLDGERDLLA